MKKKTLSLLPLLAGAIVLQSTMTSSSLLHAEEPAPRPQNVPVPARMRETPPPESRPQTPTPQPPPGPVPPPESSSWMPMHYQMPMHYRLLEPEMIYGYQLMTPRERVDYMRRIHTARSFEERDRLRLEHHRLMQERARRRGLLLPDMPGPGPRGRWR